MRFAGYYGQVERSSTPSGTLGTPTTVPETHSVTTFSHTAGSRGTSSPANSWMRWPTAGCLTTCTPSKRVTCHVDYGELHSSNLIDGNGIPRAVLSRSNHEAAATTHVEQYLLN